MYNATAYKLGADGRIVSVEAVEVDDDGDVVRACGHWSPWSGTKRFEEIWRSGFFSMVADVRVEVDGAAGYKNRLAGLALPPAYTDRGAA